MGRIPERSAHSSTCHPESLMDIFLSRRKARCPMAPKFPRMHRYPSASTRMYAQKVNFLIHCKLQVAGWTEKKRVAAAKLKELRFYLGAEVFSDLLPLGKDDQMEFDSEFNLATDAMDIKLPPLVSWKAESQPDGGAEFSVESKQFTRGI
jgi:hypothetical protein